MIRKFVTAKQADAAEAATAATANSTAAATANSTESAVTQPEAPVLPMDRQVADRSSGPALTVASHAMRGRGAKESCSLAEVMAEKRRATAALINGDLDQQLLLAASKGDTGRMHDLLEQGARVLPDEHGRTALHYAALSGYAEVVRMLLDSGICNVDTADANGFTALHKAAGNGHLDIMELLIENGKADIDLQDANGNTALHEAAWNGYSKTVQLLLANNSNAYAANNAGCTPLHLAAQKGHNQTSRTLLQAGCSPDVKNDYGDTPLHTATRYGHAGVTRILIRAKCVISEQNNNGDTPLHIAAGFRRRKIARLLMEGGIDWQLKNKHGETAIGTACRKENYEILDIIRSSASRATNIQRHMMQRPELQHDDLMAESSETNEASVDLMAALPTATAAASAEAAAADAAATAVTAAAQNKSKPGLVAWLKGKLGKGKSPKSLQVGGVGGATNGCDAAVGGAATWKDPKHRMQRMRSGGAGSAGSGSSQSGLFSQYVKHPGMAFYRDLAGNVRQGPAGYVPLYRGGGGGAGHLHPTSLLGSGALSPAEHGQQARSFAEPAAAWQPEHNGRHTDDVPEQVLHFSLRQQQTAHTTGNFGVYAQPLPASAATGGQTSGRNGGGGDDPFAYTAGVVQCFADDYRQEQCGRYKEVSSIFPGREPTTLFRSRSDETLSHSEYSYHGRAFRSREAAAVELRALNERQQLRESRRHKRQGTGAVATAIAHESVGACGHGSGADRSVQAHAETKILPLTHAFQTSAATVASRTSANRDLSWRRSAERLDRPTLPVNELPDGRRHHLRTVNPYSKDDNGNGRGESSFGGDEHDPSTARFQGGGMTLPRTGVPADSRHAPLAMPDGARTHTGKTGGRQSDRIANSAARTPNDQPATSPMNVAQRSPHDYMNLAPVTPARSPRGLQPLDSRPAATAATIAATGSYPRGPRPGTNAQPAASFDDCNLGDGRSLPVSFATGRDLYAELGNRRGGGLSDQAAARSPSADDADTAAASMADQTGRPPISERTNFGCAPVPSVQHLPMQQPKQLQQRPRNTPATTVVSRQNLPATTGMCDKGSESRVAGYTGSSCGRSSDVILRNSVAQSHSQPWSGVSGNGSTPPRPEATGADGLRSPPSAHYGPRRDLPPLLLDASVGGLTSPRIDGGSVGSNPDSGYGSKTGETTQPFDEYAAAAGISPVADVCRGTAEVQPVQQPLQQPALDRKVLVSGDGRREPLPTYESWYSQRLSEAQRQQSTTASKTPRRVVSTFTTDV